MAFTTRLTKVGHGSEHFDERTGMCYHQTPPWERVVGHVRDAGQAKPHLEHNPLSLLGACYATSRRQLNDPDLSERAFRQLLLTLQLQLDTVRSRGVYHDVPPHHSALARLEDAALR